MNILSPPKTIILVPSLLAGRLVGNRYVDCNDKGVAYVEAQANHMLFDVITDPDLKELNKFVPCDLDDGKDLCLVVQATFFSCGGMAIGLGFSHKHADGFSIAMFLNTWAAFSRGDDFIQSPIFESANLFPPNDLVRKLLEIGKREEIVTKMFVFSSRMIADLRDKYTKNTKDIEGMINPTKIGTLSAFIATRYMIATQAKGHHTGKKYTFRIAVDIRRRVTPLLSEYHYGNIFVAPQITLPPLGNHYEDGSYGIFKEMRDAIHNVNAEDWFANKNGPVICTFSSISSLPFHKADFGWGRPVWVAVASVQVRNMVYFTHSLSEGGIDAIVNMTKEDMTKFEADEELLKYVSGRDEDKLLSKI